MSQAPKPSQRQWVLGALEAYEGALARYARRLTGDDESARDLVQCAFLRLCDETPSSVRNPRQWLYAVVRNRAIDQIRKERRMKRLPLEAEDLYTSREPAPESAAESRDSCEALRRLLATLAPVQQEIVDLWSDGVPYKEIGRITQRSETNVRVIVHRAFKALREHPLAQAMLEGQDHVVGPVRSDPL